MDEKILEIIEKFNNRFDELQNVMFNQFDAINKRFDNLESDVSDLKSDITSIKLYQENVLDDQIKLIAENVSSLNKVVDELRGTFKIG